MISEKKFSSSYTSFWNDLAPMLPTYIGLANKTGLNSFHVPFEGMTVGDRGFVNEAAYFMFLYWVEGHKNFQEKGIHSAEKKVSHLEGEKVNTDIDEVELLHLFNSFKEFKKQEIGHENIRFRPFLPGCGFLNPCEGDFCFDNSLCEVKSGDRNFRGTDFKQVLIYAALAYLGNYKDYEDVILLNARRGVFFSSNIDDLTFSISGLSRVDFYERIKVFLEGQKISK